MIFITDLYGFVSNLFFRSKGAKLVMTQQNRGIMKFDSADTSPAIALSGMFILGGIVVLLYWALQVAY